MSAPRIYLDNAATSWPKPPAVAAAVERYVRESGAPAGRSAYAEAATVNQLVASLRANLARLVGADDPRRIVFAFNGTDALNMAIHGVLRPGDHAVTTAAEHNSVLRPLRELERRGEITLDIVPCDRQGLVDPGAVAVALRRPTRLVAVTHASNVTGAIQPVREIAALAHEHDALVLVDAAQTLGHLPLSVDELGADLLAAPGHKGLLGPSGTGLLYIRSGLEKSLRSLRQGGTGTLSEDDHQPGDLPHKFEAGSHNVPGLVGLAAGIDFLLLKGLAQMRAHELALAEQLWRGLGEIPGVTRHGPPESARRVGVVSLHVAHYDPQEVAASLDAVHRVQVRAGLHCAPRLHQALGTLSQGGSVRLSPGPFTTPQEITTTLAALADLATVGTE